MEVVPGLHCLAGVGLGVNAYVWRPRPADRGGSGERGSGERGSGERGSGERGSGERGSGEPVVFDCGYPWQTSTLFDSLAALGCPVEQVRTVAITHDDYDHTGGLAELVAASGADVVAHRLEVDSLQSAYWRELPNRKDVLSLVLRAVTGVAYAARPKQAVTVTRPVEDGTELPGGWVAVHTPGHTPGHLCYWHSATRVLIAGDALGSQLRGEIRANTGNYSVDDEEVIRSVRKLAALRPETICFGHGPEIVGGAWIALDRLARSLG